MKHFGHFPFEVKSMEKDHFRGGQAAKGAIAWFKSMRVNSWPH
jgi:hypothetical protein